MKNFTMKRVLAGVLCAAGVIASALTTASACTTIYAGANLTQENTRFIARSEDYGSDMNKLWFVSESGAYSGTYRGCPEYGPFTYELSHPSYRFTYFKNDNVYDGVCPECGEENAQHASYTEFGTTATPDGRRKTANPPALKRATFPRSCSARQRRQKTRSSCF